jgi:hypothetical protein
MACGLDMGWFHKSVILAAGYANFEPVCAGPLDAKGKRFLRDNGAADLWSGAYWGVRTHWLWAWQFDCHESSPCAAAYRGPPPGGR